MPIPRSLRLVSALLFCALCAPGRGQDASVAPSRPQSGVLSFQPGEIRTSELRNLLVEVPERFTDTGRYVVQLDSPITESRRRALEGLGVELQEYLPHYAYIAGLGSANPRRLAGSGLLLFVGPYLPDWKIDATLGQRPYFTEKRRESAARGEVTVVVTLFSGIPAEKGIVALDGLGIEGLTVHGTWPLAGNMTLAVTLPLSSVELLAPLDEVQFVEEAPEPIYRNSTNRWIVQSNQTDVTPLYDAGIHGEGQIIGIMDGRIDVNHCSFSDSNPIGPLHRKILAYNTTPGADVHGTHVAGTAAGDSGVADNNRGIAYLSRIVYDAIPSFTEAAMYARLENHHNQGARVHTNSWGDDGTTSYNSLARGIDSFSRDHEDSLVLFAVTNTSTLKNPENAKNLMGVGASQDTPSQDAFCSGGSGPTADGRRKPEIFAPGCGTNSSGAGTSCGTNALTGTSMASPAVAGTAALVRQYYEDGYYPTGAAVPADALTPSAALVKATLLNSAADMTAIAGYPSNQEGWGRVLADRALFFAGDPRKLIVLDDIRNASGLSTGQLTEYDVEVAGSSERLQITLVFTDFPASAATGTGPAAVNDLDLEVLSPTGDLYRGNAFSGGSSTTAGSADPGNNVEQVHIDAPATGSWTVRVRATAINQERQGYALLVAGDVTEQLPPLRVSLPAGTPALLAPGSAVDIDVVVQAGTEGVVAGSPTLHYRSDGGTYQDISLVPLGGDAYRATLPVVDCGENPEFWFSALGDQGTTVTNPATAPVSVYSAIVGAFEVLYSDDFEQDLGWTIENVDLVAGAWQRGIPAGNGDRGDPTVDADGSGRCYLTGNGPGDTDVDGGPTRLISPLYDLAGTDAVVHYAGWHSNDDGDDSLVAQISSNGGASWITADTIGPGGGGGWLQRSFRVNDFITPTSQVHVRFQVSDNPNDSVTESGIDAVRIEELRCRPAGDAPDLAVSDLAVDYDPSDSDVDAGPGGLGQAVNVIVTVRNTGNLPVTEATLRLDAGVQGGAVLTRNLVVSDFSPAAGVQTLLPGQFSDVVVSFVAGELDRCGTYSLVALHQGASLMSTGMSGPLTGDTVSGNDSLADHPDDLSDPDDAFSPDLLELDFGSIVATIRPESEIIENRATEKVKVQLAYTGFGPGMDSHDVRLFIDLVDLAGSPVYLGVLTRERSGARSSGMRSLTLRLDVSDLFPAPPAGAEYRLRLRLRDLNSSEICITSLTANSTVLQ